MRRWCMVSGVFLLAVTAAVACDDDGPDESGGERQPAAAVAPDFPQSEQPAQEAGPQRDEIVEVELDASALEYLRPICGEDAKMTDNDEVPVVDVDRLPMCPALEEDAQVFEPHKLTGGYVGDFSGDGYDEAVLNLYDTTTRHHLRQYRTVVLRQLEKGWDKSFVSNSGLGLGSCDPVQSPQRDWLVCSTGYVRHGFAVEIWNLNFVDDGERGVDEITEMVDKTGACRFEGEVVRNRKVERIEDVTGDGDVEVVFGVESTRGEPVEGFDPDKEFGQRCERDNYNFETIYHLDVWKITDDGISDIDSDEVLEHLDDPKWDRFVARPEYYPTERLIDDDLEERSLRELSLMRNTIFARAGQDFQTDWLVDYFSQQQWYDGGGLDEDELSERDRHNVLTIREYETGLSERSLRSRRQAHWSSHGLPGDGQWSAPGPFENPEDVVEAKLIDEALDELLEQTGAYRRPSDPGENHFGDTGELPDGFGELRLGQHLEVSDQRGVEPRMTNVEPLGIENRVVPVLGDDGRVQQLAAVIYGLERDGLGEGVRRLATMTILATQLSEQFGEPEVLEQPELSGARFVEELRWEGEQRVVELDNAVEMGGSKPPRVVLHTGEPDRICGPDDGFEQWYADFEDAMASDDPEEIADDFAFPFTDQGPAAGTAPPNYTSRRIEDRKEFLQRDGIGELRPGERSNPLCTNARSGYGIWTRSALAGALRFYRIDGEWTVVGLTTTPF